MFRPEAMRRESPPEPFFFDPQEILTIDGKQDENLDRLDTLLKDRAQAKKEGVKIMDSTDLQEARVMFYETHDVYLHALEEINTQATQHHQKNLQKAVEDFKAVDQELQSAFSRYEQAIQRSYQN